MKKIKVSNLELKHNIVIDWPLYKALQFLLKNKYKQEFTVLTHCKREGDTFFMYDYFLPEQVNTAAHTEFDDDDVVKLITKEKASLSDLMGHMHSHVSMPVYASGTDSSEIKERAELSGWNCSIVMNKKLEIFGHVADYDKGIYVEDIPVSVKTPIGDGEFEDMLLKEIKTSATTLDEVSDILYRDCLEFNILKDPIDNRTKKKLLKEIKDKFSSFYGSNQKSMNSYSGSNAGFIKNFNKKDKEKPVDAWSYNESYDEYDDYYDDYLDKQDRDVMGISNRNFINQ